MLLAIVNYDYYTNSNGPVLYLVCVNEAGERVILEVQDELLAPKMYILKSDLQFFDSIMREKMMTHLIVRIDPCKIPTLLNEPAMEITTKYPYDVGEIRRQIPGMLTYNSDVKWEKMCIQKLRWKQFIEVDTVPEYGFCPLSTIHPSEKAFTVNLNIAYFDIETDSKGVKKFGDWRNAHLMEIISYVIFSSAQQHYTYYGWKTTWETTVEEVKYGSIIPPEILKDYPSEYPMTIKHFHSEAEMHKQFFIDFAQTRYDGIMMFNGRGGQRIIHGQRKWFDGFDMPMLYERAVYLGLYGDIQKMSPVPFNITSLGKVYNPAVKSYDQRNEKGENIKHEITIKCVPQFDLLYDELVLMYTKEEYDMKRHNLDTYMEHFLKCNKIGHKGLSVAKLFQKNPEKQMLYNCVDVEGMVGLDLYFGYINDVAGRAFIFAGKIEDGVYASKLHDHVNLWFTSNEYLMDTRDNERDDWEGLVHEKLGGFNLEPMVGIYGYFNPIIIFALDFSKLYPTCTMTANADLRTKINLDHLSIRKGGLHIVDNKGDAYCWNDCARSPAGFFRKDILSLNTIIYEELISKRKIFQKLSDKALVDGDIRHYKQYKGFQFSYKGLINGKFGTTGVEGDRSYDKVIYNTPPTMGQELIHFVIDWLKERGYPSIFASTDSAFSIAKNTDVRLAWEEVQSLLGELNDAIESFVIREFNPIKNYAKLDCEKLSSLFVLFDKRRYMMNIVAEEKDGKLMMWDKPRLLFRGLELVRRDAAMITYDVQLHIFEMISQRKSLEEIGRYIKEIDEKFMHYPWEYICGRAGISDDIDEGDESNQKYKACINANKMLDRNYTGGDDPLLGIFKKHPVHFNGVVMKPSETVVMAMEEEDEFQLKKQGFDLDYKKLKEVHLIKKVNGVLAIFGKNMTYEKMIRGTVSGITDV